MNKKIILVITMAIITMVCFSSISCGDDDDVISVRQQLVGIWQTSMTSSNWKVIELVSDGSINYCMYINSDGEICYSDYDVPDQARWTFNESEQIISMYSDKGTYTFTYKVTMGDDGTFWSGYDQVHNKVFSFRKLDSSRKKVN